MTTPQRIQRKRSAGWTMPPNTIYVGRPSMWGNPFTIAQLQAQTTDTPDVVAAMWVTRWYRQWLEGSFATAEEPARRDAILSNIEKLRGHDLACWCAPHRHCHADVLLDIANEVPTDGFATTVGELRIKSESQF